jgi:hypothetical protein
VSLFRRREPLHVRLAREGGIALADEPEPRAPWGTSGIHGLHQPREWDVVSTVVAPTLEGERSRFVALDGGTFLVEEGPDAIAPLAEAVERDLPVPYRAEAVRRDGGLWAVAARRIDVRELTGLEGEEIELTLRGEERSLVVDGEPAFGSIPALERPEHVLRARRLDGDVWEVAFDPL